MALEEVQTRRGSGGAGGVGVGCAVAEVVAASDFDSPGPPVVASIHVRLSRTCSFYGTNGIRISTAVDFSLTLQCFRYLRLVEVTLFG